ncbi:[NiFe]-hydrogenase assembly chaperone HybE [Mariprofundus ferrooxydans]|nr:[NiFe]-hydrogenase assembly chaperone HybE [Mariprofundus ferrooxydans]
MGAAYHLEQLYDDIRVNRMADIPILNDKIKVQAVGFREWNHHVLGALITPWFMNLMLLPTEETDWSTYGVGSKHSYTFEAGLFEFIVGEEENLGKYMSCSMFSPMFDFADHDAAVQTAEAIVVGMFKEENKEELVGESMSPADDAEAETGDAAGLTETMLEGAQAIGSIAKENLEKPLSRRELLRGGFLKNVINKT